jgi:hypothetical protein
MSAVVRRRTGLAVLLAAAALTLGPVVAAAPAHAAETSPPVATEPPGGATCLPNSPDAATCGQEPGTTTTASPTATPSATPSASPVADPTTLPDTGSAPQTGPAPRVLAHTGGGAWSGWGYTGTGLLVGGSLIVLATRRRGSRT